MEDKDSYDVVDPRGYVVSLSSHTYEKHIIEESGHAELTPPEIMETVKSPVVIYQSSRDESVDVYFGKSSQLYPPLYVKAAVEIDEESKTGKVKTAFLSKHISGGIKEGELKYVNFANGKL